MIALKPTIIESGLRSPADYLPDVKPDPSRVFLSPRKAAEIPEVERRRRTRVVNQAVEKAGNNNRLHLATGFPASTISRWREGESVPPIEKLEVIEAWLEGRSS